jgi:hypothetical protein
MSSSQEAQGRWLWLWNRLRCMQPAEVLYRARRAVQGRLERALSLRAVRVPMPSIKPAPVWVHRPEPTRLVQGLAPYVAEADALRAGSLRLFEQQRFAVGARPNWLLCPLTQVQAPALPSHQLRITDRAQVGDIKYLWEMNRHLHWVTLAQAWALAARDEDLALLAAQIDDWLAQNPMGVGPNWTSALEASIRLVNWTVVCRRARRPAPGALARSGVPASGLGGGWVLTPFVGQQPPHWRAVRRVPGGLLLAVLAAFAAFGAGGAFGSH